MALTKIKEVDGYLKDETSGAVLSVDQNALDAYKRQRSQRNSIVSDINNIKQELGELKDMLSTIISSQKGN
tara:strand:+ start:1012 stop:1224 length:213 start_codon:yes stop_codon:yes gene_type:complete